MKKPILLLTFLLFPILIFSQVNIDSIVNIGVKYHDNGQYDKAIETYQTALEIDPNSSLVNYEMSYSFMMAKEYKKAISHADKVIELNDKYLLSAYITKGSCLDYLGENKKSIKIFKEAIKKFGDDYLLYYNLGYDYYYLEDYKNAEKSLLKAIENNPKHASSHLMLGNLMSDLNQKSKSLLCLHYFLFLEPNTARSVTAYNLLKRQFKGNVEKDKEKPDQINIYIDPKLLKSEFGNADMMLSMIEATNAEEENKGKSDDELFIKNTSSFFQVLGELKTDKTTGLWWDLYVALFYDIARSEYIDAYCYYISQSSNNNAKEWLNNNSLILNEFSNWLSNRK